MSDNGFAVRLESVTKRFGKHTAVSGFDFEVPRGVICGLLGPNGSGKTTTIRMIMGILNPDEGRVSLFGSDPDVTRRTKVGYLPEERGLYKKMKVLELLTFLAEIRGVKRGEGRKRAGEWLALLNAAILLHRAAKGFHRLHLFQKILQCEGALAQLFLHAPGFILLNSLSRLLNQTDHIPHAQNTTGHAFRMERLKFIKLLAHANKLYRPTGDTLHR